MSAAPPAPRRHRISDLARLPEATWALVAARAVLRTGGLCRMERLSRRLVRRLDVTDVDADGLRWAADAVANRIGGECLPRAFALQ